MATAAPTPAVGTGTLTVKDTASANSFDLQLDFDTTTPQQVIDHLLTEGHFVATNPQDGTPLTYSLVHNSTPLFPGTPLAQQGVSAGSTVEMLSPLTKGAL